MKCMCCTSSSNPVPPFLTNSFLSIANQEDSLQVRLEEPVDIFFVPIKVHLIFLTFWHMQSFLALAIQIACPRVYHFVYVSMNKLSTHSLFCATDMPMPSQGINLPSVSVSL